MRLSIWLPCLCLLLASCSLLPPRRPLKLTAAAPTATPRPAPLVQARGSSTSYASPHFFVPAGGWIARWSYDCTHAVQGSRRALWHVTIVVRHSPFHAHPGSLAQQIVDASPGTVANHTPVLTRGSTVVNSRGLLYIQVTTTGGCSWSVAALRGP